jgi:hypothetical protein
MFRGFSQAFTKKKYDKMAVKHILASNTNGNILYFYIPSLLENTPVGLCEILFQIDRCYNVVHEKRSFFVVIVLEQGFYSNKLEQKFVRAKIRPSKNSKKLITETLHFI